MSITRNKMLQEAYDYCIECDKSTEYLIQYMQDYAGVSLDVVIRFLQTKH
jgi:hypothetical protein